MPNYALNDRIMTLVIFAAIALVGIIPQYSAHCHSTNTEIYTANILHN